MGCLSSWAAAPEERLLNLRLLKAIWRPTTTAAKLTLGQRKVETWESKLCGGKNRRRKVERALLNLSLGLGEAFSTLVNACLVAVWNSMLESDFMPNQGNTKKQLKKKKKKEKKKQLKHRWKHSPAWSPVQMGSKKWQSRTDAKSSLALFFARHTDCFWLHIAHWNISHIAHCTTHWKLSIAHLPWNNCHMRLHRRLIAFNDHDWFWMSRISNG